jgi:hypothetical protein
MLVTFGGMFLAATDFSRKIDAINLKKIARQEPGDS